MGGITGKSSTDKKMLVITIMKYSSLPIDKQSSFVMMGEHRQKNNDRASHFRMRTTSRLIPINVHPLFPLVLIPLWSDQVPHNEDITMELQQKHQSLLKSLVQLEN